ncbi:MAG: protein kinase domain-containing protein [Bacteroidia bacterium]
MSYPSRTDIETAVRYPQFIKDSFFDGATLELTSRGQPMSYGGGFSQVFPMLKEGKKWAFKIWYKEIKENQKRHEKIKAYLNECNLPYFLEFQFVEKGLLVNGQLLDTLRMEWANGLFLIEYMALHLKNPDKLKKLGENFLQMTKALHENRISHGDLHHENIFITNNDEIRLIDYDSICVPELEGQDDICRGREGFQHPSRLTAACVASSKVDHFSELIIYLSIQAIVECPVFWETYGIGKTDVLLFEQRDFYYWENSKIKKDLNTLSPDVKKLVQILENYLASHLLLTPIYKH